MAEELRDTAGDFVISGLGVGDYSVTAAALQGPEAEAATKELKIEKAPRDGYLGVWIPY